MNIYKTVIDGKVLSDAFYAVGGYDYTVYISGRSSTGVYSWLIQRANVAGTEYRYALGTSTKKTVDVAITNKADLVYSRMDLIKTSQ